MLKVQQTQALPSRSTQENGEKDRSIEKHDRVSIQLRQGHRTVTRRGPLGRLAGEGGTGGMFLRRGGI